ncbi:ATP-binding protein [Vibrio penaeicida]|uniref:ATP-binding protein n=1 Tax=Vibrio penaeicida TaxID=104609 RepID=UPI0027347838|nr:ATP-binding protein [Vibrio penaeicida]MDP2571996.1 ATP-binding protein [Vibrio penaeicida]
MFSSLVTVFITAFQLYTDYAIDKKNINSSQEYIFSSYQDALQTSLWVLNSDLIESQVNGIISIPEITYVHIESKDGDVWSSGIKLDKHIVKQSVVLQHEYLGGKVIDIGTLTIQSDLSVVYQKLLNKGFLILMSNGLKTFFVAGFIIFIVSRLVTNPLNQMSQYFRGYQFKQINPPMVIERNKQYGDEIDFMVSIVNKMCSELTQSYDVLMESRKQLAEALDDKQKLLEKEIRFKENLEVMVQDRTAALESTLDELKSAQKSIVEQEKMASLGGLVGGVAHEINTPLGISITASSFLEDQITGLSKDFDSGKLTRSKFAASMQDISESVSILTSNLQRAEVLVSSFKQVAVDQSDQSYQRFLFKEHLEKLIVSLSHELKLHDAKIEVQCEDSLSVESYPSAYVQIFTNLITNSLKHGFDDWGGERCISIAIASDTENLVIDYRDTGKGISSEVNDRIFEPFVTTKRGKGGTGLGANIVYNLVTQLLKGQIESNSDIESGAQFIITAPLDLASTSYVI